MYAENWHFVSRNGSVWYWLRVQTNGSHIVSSRTFDTSEACMKDAIAHGFAPNSAAAMPLDRSQPDLIVASSAEGHMSI
jgi:hypothetical protein